MYEVLMTGYLPFNHQKTKDYANKAISLSYQYNELRVRQNALRHLGLLHYGREEYDSAMIYFMQALAVIDTMKTDKQYDENIIDDALSALYGTIANS